MAGLGIVWAILKRYWMWILLAIVIASAYFYITGLIHENKALNQKVTELQIQKKICEDNTRSLEEKLDMINRSIDQLSDVTQKQTAKLDALGRDVTARTKDIKNDVQTVLNGQKPKSCEDAIKYLIDARKEYTK